jgi:hypothetical protein
MNTSISDPEIIQAKSSHAAYADDTHHNFGRYRGVGLITTSVAEGKEITSEIWQIIRGCEISELKWTQLRSAKVRNTAIAILDLILSKAVARAVRVDVLTWDIEDSRHRIQGRNDRKNLIRMYYFLFKDVLAKRWPIDAKWEIYIDESAWSPWWHLGYLQDIFDWETGKTIAEVNITEVWSAHSHENPLIQVADLFAGLGVFSRENYLRYSQQGNLNLDLSNSERERFTVLQYFHHQCKSHKLGVSLNQRGGLRSFNPEKPINFWWYEPQGYYDKAPK